MGIWTPTDDEEVTIPSHDRIKEVPDFPDIDIRDEQTLSNTQQEDGCYQRSSHLLDTTLDGGLIEKISDWEPVASPVPDTTLDGRPMEGTTNLEHSALVGSLDSGLMAGMSCLEPLEQSVLNTLLVS